MDKRLRELTGEPQDQPSGLPLSEAGARKATFAVEVLADMIHNNAALTVADMQEFAGELEAAAEVEVGGCRFSVEQLKSNPELRRNIAIWKEIMSESYDRYEKLTLLIPAVAAALARIPSSRLYLDGLTSLDLHTATALAGFGGDELYLGGLTSLDPATAAALAGFGGDVLSLNSLTALDRETATALAQFEGKMLSLFGLTALEPEAAALAGFPGTIISKRTVEAEIDRYKSQAS